MKKRPERMKAQAMSISAGSRSDGKLNSLADDSRQNEVLARLASARNYAWQRKKVQNRFVKLPNGGGEGRHSQQVSDSLGALDLA